MCHHHGHTHHCGLALSTEQSQRDAEIIFFLFSFFPSFVSSLLLALSHPPSLALFFSLAFIINFIYYIYNYCPSPQEYKDTEELGFWPALICAVSPKSILVFDTHSWHSINVFE